MRRNVCGVVPAQHLPIPMPPRAALVYVSCLGGPYPCVSNTPQPPAPLQQLSGPLRPRANNIATMHVVSSSKMHELVALYRGILGDAFMQLSSQQCERVTFMQLRTASSKLVGQWAPRRLHLVISPTKGVFHTQGFNAQLRLTLSLVPPGERPTFFRCRNDTRSSIPRGYLDRRWVCAHVYRDLTRCRNIRRPKSIRLNAQRIRL